MQTKIHLDMLIRKQADIWQAEVLTWWYAMMSCRHAEMAEVDLQTGWNADILIAKYWKLNRNITDRSMTLYRKVLKKCHLPINDPVPLNKEYENMNQVIQVNEVKQMNQVIQVIQVIQINQGNKVKDVN